MSSYLEKCYELYSSGKEIREIIENIYINYSSFQENDKIYDYKKNISKQFLVSLKDIKLIGSSHTYFSNKSGIKSKENLNDYDFAIINTTIFNNYWVKIILDNTQISDVKKFNYNLIKGKIHPLYLKKDKSLFKEINDKLNSVRADKKISICLYMSEEAFVENLCNYLEKDLEVYFKTFKVDVSKSSTINIKDVKKII